MGFWYMLSIVFGISLCVGIQFSEKKKENKKIMIILGAMFILFGFFMMSPMSVKLIDIFF